MSSFAHVNQSVVEALLYPTIRFTDLFPTPAAAGMHWTDNDSLSLAMDIALQWNRTDDSNTKGKVYLGNARLHGSDGVNNTNCGVVLVNDCGAPVMRVWRDGDYNIDAIGVRIRQRNRPNDAIQSEKRSYIVKTIRDKMDEVVTAANHTIGSLANNMRAQLNYHIIQRAFPDGQDSSEFKVKFIALEALLRIALKGDTEISTPVEAMNEIERVRDAFYKVKNASALRAAAINELNTKEFWSVLYYQNHGFVITRVDFKNNNRFNNLTKPTMYRNLERFEEMNPTMHGEFMVAHAMCKAMRPNNNVTSTLHNVGAYSNNKLLINVTDDIGADIPYGDYGTIDMQYQAGYYSRSGDLLPQGYLLEVSV